MYCANCGKKLEDDWTACPFCGCEIERDEEPEEQSGSRFVGGDLAASSAASEGRPIDGRKSADYAAAPPEQRLEEFSFLKFVLLSLVTCGIYEIYKLYQYTKTVNKLCEGDGQESPNYIVVTVLGVLTLGVYLYYWLYKQTQRLKNAAPKYDCRTEHSGMKVLAWATFGNLIGVGIFVAWYYMFSDTNLLIRQYNAGVMHRDYSYPSFATEKKGSMIAMVAGFYLTVLIVAAVVPSGLFWLLTRQEEEIPTVPEEPQIQEPQVQEPQTQEPTEENTQADSSEYIFPESDSRYLTEDEVRSKDSVQLRIGRNEIFARYGAIFQSDDLNQHFSECSWYQATVPVANINPDTMFNDFERKNIDLIKKVENELNGGGSISFIGAEGTYVCGTDGSAVVMTISKLGDQSVDVVIGKGGSPGLYGERGGGWEGTIVSEDTITVECWGALLSLKWYEENAFIVTRQGATGLDELDIMTDGQEYWNMAVYAP